LHWIWEPYGLYQTIDYVYGLPPSMAVKTYTWITLWFLLTTPVILWDVSYCFMRPRSMVGGDLHWIWEPYGLYQTIDYVYGLPHFEGGHGFTNAQSFLNIIETALNLAYIYLAYKADWAPAPVIGFAGAVMTVSKTVLYGMQEVYCSGTGCTISHNDLKTLLVFWILPNGLWIVVPGLIVWRLGRDLVQSLNFEAKTLANAAGGKGNGKVKVQ